MNDAVGIEGKVRGCGKRHLHLCCAEGVTRCIVRTDIAKHDRGEKSRLQDVEFQIVARRTCDGGKCCAQGRPKKRVLRRPYRGNCKQDKGKDQLPSRSLWRFGPVRCGALLGGGIHGLKIS